MSRNMMLQAGNSTARRLVPGVGTCVAGVIALFSFGPLLEENVVIGIINVLVVVTFTGTGLLLWTEAGQRGTGIALATSSLFYVMSWWWSWPPIWQVGPVPILSYVCGYLWFVLGVYALLRYPEPELTRWWDRLYVQTLAAWVIVSKLLLAFISQPDWIGGDFPAESWWPAIWPTRGLFDVASDVADIGLVVVAVAVAVPLALKVKRSRSVDRIDAVPGMAAAATVMVSGSAYLLAQYGPFPEGTVDALRAVIGVAALFTPLAFLTSALQRRLARAAVADLIVRLVDSPTPTAVQSEVRRSLSDSTAQVWFWLPDLNEFVDVDDNTSRTPPAQGRFEVEVRSRDEDPLAVLVLDPALRRHPKLVAPAVAACRFALENTRMHADLRSQLRELQAAAVRLTKAESAGRRKIERDLHDGAHQTLWAARMSLGEARRHLEPGSEAHAAIQQAQADLSAATDELRQLARGIASPILTQSGLRAALESVVERLGKGVVLTEAPAERFEAAVESTAYFVACEAATNAAKHAEANATDVTVVRSGGDLLITVQDNGKGGVDVSAGSGLAGMSDRARAIGGTMAVRSWPGQGTLIEVRLPCE